MKVVKVRRLGNSNVVVLPRDLEEAGYAPGASVLIEKLDDGSLRIIPATHLHEAIRKLGERVVDENREALEILAEHDRTSDEGAGTAG